MNVSIVVNANASIVGRTAYWKSLKVQNASSKCCDKNVKLSFVYFKFEMTQKTTTRLHIDISLSCSTSFFFCFFSYFFTRFICITCRL